MPISVHMKLENGSYLKVTFMVILQIPCMFYPKPFFPLVYYLKRSLGSNILGKM